MELNELNQENIVEKAKKFIANNKGKLAALAALAAVGGAGYYAYKQGAFEDAARKFGEKAFEFADKEHQIKIENTENQIKELNEKLQDAIKNGDKDAIEAIRKKIEEEQKLLNSLQNNGQLNNQINNQTDNQNNNQNNGGGIFI